MVVVALRFASLAFAGSLTLALLAVPSASAGAGCDLGASSLADASLGASCSVSESTTGVAVDTCHETTTDEGYLYEDATDWQTPVWSSGTRTVTETPCTSHDGEASCQAWQHDADLDSPWLYPNAGAACEGAGGERACFELLESHYTHADDLLGSQSGTPCGPDRIPYDA